MIDKNKYFKFYACCIPVQGVNRGVICDLQRGSFYFVPSSIIEVLNENKNKKLINLYNTFRSKEKLIDKYLNYLIENELIFLTNEPNHFIQLNTGIKNPFLIDTIILEIDTVQSSLIDLLENIDALGCINLVLIVKEARNLKNIKFIMDACKFSKIEIINVLARYNDLISNELLAIRNENLRLRYVTLYEANKDEKLFDEFITKTTLNLEELLTKRISSINDFTLNIKAYTESINYNLFFNRKIYIDSEGSIKHYFTESVSYGNIKKDKIKDVILSDNFQELWSINKEKVEICCECEFRYVCPDNRIPSGINPKNQYIHNLNCNYDPKTNHWKI